MKVLQREILLIPVLLLVGFASLAADSYQIVHTFLGPDGAQPFAKLTLASDGLLYGTTSLGGSNNTGTIFRLTPEGKHEVIWNFGPDGTVARAEIVEGSDGALYGTTVSPYFGSTGTNGTVFKLNKDGTNFKILQTFPPDSPQPQTALIDNKNGALYGTASITPAPGGLGTVYTLNLDGSGYQVLYDQIHCSSEQFWPVSSLIIGSDGGLYGAGSGADRDRGMIFRLDQITGTFTPLYTFSAETNSFDYRGEKYSLIEGSDGFLYGTIRESWILYRIAKDGSNYKVVHRFGDSHDLWPGGQLLEGEDGFLYGVTGVDQGPISEFIYKIKKDGTSHIILHHFGVTPGDGHHPESGLTQGSDGALYGTTALGGDPTAGPFGIGAGTIYKIWPQVPYLEVGRTNGTARITVTGMSGYNYQMLTSPDFTNWAPLTNFPMPSTGTDVYTHTNPPPAASFYRAAWIP